MTGPAGIAWAHVQDCARQFRVADEAVRIMRQGLAAAESELERKRAAHRAATQAFIETAKESHHGDQEEAHRGQRAPVEGIEGVEGKDPQDGKEDREGSEEMSDTTNQPIRISVDKSDPAYSIFAVHCRVTVDGVQQQLCITADEAAGVATGYQVGENGMAVKNGDELAMETASGRVEVSLREHVPGTVKEWYARLRGGAAA